MKTIESSHWFIENLIKPNTPKLRIVNRTSVCEEISNIHLLTFPCYLLWQTLAKGISRSLF